MLHYYPNDVHLIASWMAPNIAHEHLAARGQSADASWVVMAYGHKTQSFMKTRGQQKCLDKAPCTASTYKWSLLYSRYFSRIFQPFRNTCFMKIDGCSDVLLLFSRVQKDAIGLILFWCVLWLPNQFRKCCQFPHKKINRY